MIVRARHLHEDHLFACYVAEQSGDQIDRPSAEHLSACDQCRTRYTELASFMDTLRTEAEAESDEIFTSDELRAQELHILRRIEHLGHPARVLSFPGRIVRRHFTPIGGRVAPRWTAAAAAAGLLIGVGVGVVFDARHHATPPAAMAMTIARPSQAAAPAVAVSAPIVDVDDDAFLSEIEAVLRGPHNQELLPFDVLTPRVQEIAADFR